MISGETTLETLEMEGFRLAEKENASSATTLPGKTNLPILFKCVTSRDGGALIHSSSLPAQFARFTTWMRHASSAQTTEKLSLIGSPPNSTSLSLSTPPNPLEHISHHQISHKNQFSFSQNRQSTSTASFFRQSFGHSRNSSFSFRACGRFNHRSFSSVSSHQPVRALTHEQNIIFFLKNKQLKFDVVELGVTPDPTSPLQSVPDDQPYVCSFCEMRFVLVVSLPTHIHQAYSKMDMTELIMQLFEAEREYLLRGMKKITMLEKLLHIVLHIFSSSFGASASASQPYSLDLLSEKKIPFSFRGDAKKHKGDEIGLIEFNRMGGGLSHSGGSTSSIATVSSESITVSSTNTYTSAFVDSVSSSSTSEL
ncbi:uncharacterized protein MONOS_16653 [Monocercomonoides exilis]|uniref:uncharacterized protein n=1 Tax=Monocercomonoides exilis TaxID=2049356 RepID=UPI003559FCC4|nr:hypothetical protein MONOS_16653 [Monocercomonoides exilis]|eukprot:MONOS_16653.1-p1 / transcript=MONOS_16653.1 / gene=MONOS_16653 / organism=Monocercomonoides_exilis_PA203 / gene_product=unspecified product / transcript_product=unspecified product / location=Mono_scaffold01969:408-2260(+) / protein_length=367 / sequence_SO=supercontig / SO=protein_coding / is_pseudo=false